MEMMVWNTLLTAILAVVGFMVMEKFKEVNRLGMLINRTREEVARDHITRVEVHRDLEKIMDRFDAGFKKLEDKIDAMNTRREIHAQ
jgi:hypothetical protein